MEKSWTSKLPVDIQAHKQLDSCAAQNVMKLTRNRKWQNYEKPIKKLEAETTERNFKLSCG